LEAGFDCFYRLLSFGCLRLAFRLSRKHVITAQHIRVRNEIDTSGFDSIRTSAAAAIAACWRWQNNYSYFGKTTLKKRDLLASTSNAALAA
jgi:hypothetical protein